MTQRERVLRLMQMRGQEGVTQQDFLAPDVADGGSQITRVGARIDELRARYYIHSPGVRSGFKVYVLGRPRDAEPAEAPVRVAPAPPRPSPPAPVGETLQLLDDAAARGGRSAIFDTDDFEDPA